MKLTKKNHRACLVYYTALLLEIVVSGYYTELDSFFFATRLGIILVSVAAIEIGYNEVLKYVGVIIVILSASGVRKEYAKIEKEKFETSSKLEVTKIKEPLKPVISDCSIQPKYARPKCNDDNTKLQLTYSEELKKFNASQKKSENKIKTLDTSLSFYDCQPILIYVILIGGISALSVIGVKKPENEVKPKKIESVVTGFTNIEKVKLIEKRNETEKISQEKLCKEYGISLSEFKRLRAKLKPKNEPKQILQLVRREEIA